MLSYRLPREPSGPRTTLWRRLKKLGVAQLSDGLVALPADARTREQFDWAADDVIGASGTAGVWLARGMAAARAAEYYELADRCSAVVAAEPADRRRALRRLRAEWRAIGRRDFFPPAARDEAAAALRELERSLTAEPVR
jgi:hypothetical protein